jgi:uroporphyrinogen-III synthase
MNAVALPLIDVGPVPNKQSLQEAWARLHTFDAVMFVSSNAVEQFFASNTTVAPVFTAQSAIKTRAFSTGPGTVAALLRAQVALQFLDAPDLQAGQFDSEALWAVVRQQVQPGFRLLIVRGTDMAADTVDVDVDMGGKGTGDEPAAGDAGQGRDWFAHQAAAAGATVEFVVAYQRMCPQLTAAEQALAQQAASDGSVWLFSSSQAIAHLQACCPKQSWQQARAVVSHPRIGLAAREAGFAVVCESRPTPDALIASIKSLQ